MTKVLVLIIGITLAIALSCQRMFQMENTDVVSSFSMPTTKLQFPQPWLEAERPVSFVQQIEVRKLPNSSDNEFFFAALPYGDNNYAHEVDKKMPATRYTDNVFAVDFSSGLRVRAASEEEWKSGSRIRARPRPVFQEGNDDSTGEIEYRQKRYSKVGKYWGQSMLSPTGKWLAAFSYTGEKRPPDLLFGGGDPLDGDIFWQIYDTVTGQKVFEWEARNVKNPTRFDGPVVWLEDRYFLFPADEDAQSFNVVTLRPPTPEVNPLTIQLPSRKDSSGRPLPAGDRDEVWMPLLPLTKEQAVKLTAKSETEITKARLSADHRQLLLAINEETENRPAKRLEKDGPGEYHYRVISTYYFAVPLENPIQTRVANKEEWDRSQTLRIDRPRGAEGSIGDTIKGTIPPYRQFPKTGKSWGSPPIVGAGEWIAVFSYNEDATDNRARPGGKMFVDIYDQRLGDKLLSTMLSVTVSPNELFKSALWIEGGYILLPLNASLDSFALWQLP